jgi:hypothetical protein
MSTMTWHASHVAVADTVRRCKGTRRADALQIGAEEHIVRAPAPRERNAFATRAVALARTLKSVRA